MRRNDLALDEDLIQHDVVMSWTCRVLNDGMGLYEEVSITKLGDVAIDADAVFEVARAIDVGFLCEKARMMALAHSNDDGFWKLLLRVDDRVYIDAGFANQKKLDVDDDVVVLFEDTVSIDEKIFGEKSVFASGFPETKARGDHAVEFDNHFLPGLLNAQVGGSLAKSAVDAECVWCGFWRWVRHVDIDHHDFLFVDDVQICNVN